MGGVPLSTDRFKLTIVQNKILEELILALNAASNPNAFCKNLVHGLLIQDQAFAAHLLYLGDNSRIQVLGAYGYGDRQTSELESSVWSDSPAAQTIRNKKSMGFESDTLLRFNQLLARPHGIVLVTGPTGSGKTTTLYAALSKIDSDAHKIITVEEPVEYQLEGINQIQVHQQIGLSFARALRSILRQDPDIIMIGEIRDLETAQIAIQASLTGHLVLATLHTNDAASAVTRLTDMGVEPFLLSSSLLGVLAQRLVRKRCTACSGAGCAQCGHTGYAGRTGVFELLVTDDAIRAQIHNQASEAAIRDAALASGMVLMRDDGQRLVDVGITTREELLRVTRD